MRAHAWPPSLAQPCSQLIRRLLCRVFGVIICVTMSVQSGLWASSSLYSRFGGHSSTCLTLPNSKYTLIAFLGAAQILSVDLLPITWNSALNDVGVGGTATLRERLISQNLSFLFKRVHPRHFQDYEARVAEDIAYRTLVAELETARNYEVVKSEFLAHLEGVSWDGQCLCTRKPNMVASGLLWRVLMCLRQSRSTLLRDCRYVHILPRDLRPFIGMVCESKT
jgi:hypothetical protein